MRTLGTKRESDVRYKVEEMGVKQAEPRLKLKKHRRVLRKQLKHSLLDLALLENAPNTYLVLLMSCRCQLKNIDEVSIGHQCTTAYDLLSTHGRCI